METTAATGRNETRERVEKNAKNFKGLDSDVYEQRHWLHLTRGKSEAGIERRAQIIAKAKAQLLRGECVHLNRNEIEGLRGDRGALNKTTLASG